MPIIRVEFLYQPGEYARALRYVQVRRLLSWRDSIVALFVIAISIFLWVTGGFTFWVTLFCAVGILLLAMIAFGIFVTPVLVERSQPKLRERYQLTFSDDGIHFITANIDSQLSWNLYSTWWDGPDFLFFFSGKRDLSVIPYRAFSNPVDIDAMRQLARRHIGPAKYSGSRLT